MKRPAASSTTTAGRRSHPIGVAAAVFAAAVLSAVAPGVAHAAEPVATIAVGSAVYGKPLDSYGCAAVDLCRPPPSNRVRVPADVPVVWRVDRPGAAVEVICSVGAFAKVQWASDQPPGWVDKRNLQLRSTGGRGQMPAVDLGGRCWPWEMR